MMGASVGGGGEFGTFFEFINMLDDKDKYEAKVTELAKKLGDAQREHTMAIEKVKQSEANLNAANQILAQGEKALADAQRKQELLDRQAANLGAQTHELANKLADYDHKAKELEQHEATVKAELAKQEADLKQRNEAARLAEAAVAKLRKDAEAEIAQKHQATDRGNDAKIQQVQATLDAAAEKYAQAEKFRAEIEAKHQQVQAFFGEIKETTPEQ